MRKLHTFGIAGILVVAGCGGGGGGGGGGPGPGTLYFSQDDNANGLFILNTTTGAATLVGLGTTDTTSSTIGLTESDDSAFLIGSTFRDLLMISADGSGTTDLGAPVVQAEGLAFHRPTGLLYAIINQAFQSVEAATSIPIEPLTGPPVDLEGLASDYDDGIYGLGDSTDLYLYDISSDSWSVVGDTG